MSWRIALIDSCGSWPGAVDAAAFVSVGRQVERRAPVTDRSGHGSRVAQLFANGDAAFELLLGQVFLGAEPASAAAVAAAVDWAVAERADLIHMSLGLKDDRVVLAAAVKRATGSGCIIVASMPARGGLVYPAAYPQVIRATGDARCAPEELSHLGPGFFGGCPRFAVGGSQESAASIGVGAGGGAGSGAAGGASVGAAWVTRNILRGPKHRDASALVAALTSSARYLGAERRGLLSAT